MDFSIKPIKVSSKIDKYNKCIENTPLFKMPFRLCICGGSNCGKTCLTIRLLEFYLNYCDFIKPSDIFIFNPTFSLGDNPKKYSLLNIPKSNIYEKIPKNDDEDLINLIENRKQKNKPWFLILDDCAGQKSTHKNNTLTELFYSVRHSYGSVILISQKYNAISTGIRANCSQCILFRNDNKKEKQTFMNELCGDLDTKEFEKMYNYITLEPYSFMCIDLTANPKHRFRKNLNKIIVYEV